MRRNVTKDIVVHKEELLWIATVSLDCIQRAVHLRSPLRLSLSYTPLQHHGKDLNKTYYKNKCKVKWLFPQTCLFLLLGYEPNVHEENEKEDREIGEAKIVGG